MLFDPVTMSNPGESAIVRLGAAKLAVISGSPGNGSVAIVDTTTGDVKVVHAPLCGAATSQMSAGAQCARPHGRTARKRTPIARVFRALGVSSILQ